MQRSLEKRGFFKIKETHTYNDNARTWFSLTQAV